ncbi:MAG: hypothetical protein WCY01_05380, partial [Alkalispirochaeta sp.]
MSHPAVTSPLWDEIDITDEKSETLAAVHRTFAGDVWFRFRHKPASVVGLVLIAFILLFAIFGPFLSNHSYAKQELAFVNIPPRLDLFMIGDDAIYVSRNLKPIHVASDGTLLSALPRIEENLAKKVTSYDFNGQTVAVDYSVRPARLIDPSGTPVTETVTVHNKTYLLGTDKLGRDLLTRLMIGARISLLVAFVAAFTNLVIGVLYGGISAYIGGNTDTVMMRIVDVVATVPLTLYVILIMVVLPRDSGITSIIIALGSVYWVNMA